jgi:DNA-binding transcriptional LysR family regulator
MVNLEWYRSFVEVYRVGTVSKAAEILYLTQPAVSQHIAALESILGTPLFERMPRRMVPTEAGKRLYTRVVMSIETLASVPTKLSLTDVPLEIRLGAPIEFFSEYVLERLPKDDNIRLKIQFGLVEELIEGLLADRFDCAIATKKVAKPELEYQPIFVESFWLVGSPNMTIPRSLDDLTELEQWLRTQPLIAYGEDLPIIRRFWRVIFDRRLDLAPRFIVPDLRAIRSAIAQGLGYSILPDYLCTAWITDGRLIPILQPKQAVTNQIWLVYRRAERKSPQVQLLLECLVNHPI